MGLVSSKDCIWTEFTSQTPTQDYSIVPSSISRNSSAPNVESISGYPFYTRKNSDWPFGFLQVLSRQRSANATKKTDLAVIVVPIDATIIHGWSPRAWCVLTSALYSADEGSYARVLRYWTSPRSCHTRGRALAHASAGPWRPPSAASAMASSAFVHAVYRRARVQSVPEASPQRSGQAGQASWPVPFAAADVLQAVAPPRCLPCLPLPPYAVPYRMALAWVHVSPSLALCIDVASRT